MASALVDSQFGFLSAVTLSSLGVVHITRAKFAEYDFDLHIRGIKIRSEKEVIKEQGELPYGLLPWGRDYIEPRQERLHFLLFGNIGGGKTTFMKMMMASVAARPGETWIVFDPKIELVPYLTALGKTPLIFNPLDTRTTAWDVSKDIVNSALAQGLAELIIDDESSADKTSSDGDHWTLSSQNVLMLLIETYIDSGLPWDFRDICNAAREPEDLITILSRNKHASVIIDSLRGTHKSGTNDYILTLNTKLRPLYVVASCWHNAPQRVSMRELAENNGESFKDCAIVLGSDHTAGSIIASLNGLMFERLQQLLMNTHETDSTAFRVWGDEISAVTRRTAKALVKLMTQGRSKGVSVGVCTQNEAGIIDRFGKELARQLFDTAVNKAVIGGVDGLTGKLVSEELGEVDLVEADIGYSSSNLTVDNQIDKGRSQKSATQNINQSYRRTRRPALPKERLSDTAMDSAGPDTGLHGFFMGSKAGPHFAKFDWPTVMSMQVEPDPNTSAYSKLSENSANYRLAPWTPAERAKWGLSKSPPLPDWSNDDATISRATILETTEITEQALEECLIDAGLSPSLKTFTSEQIEMMGLLNLEVNTVTLTVI